MAATEIEITYEWENRVNFKATVKENGGDAVLTIEVEENGELSSVWGSIRSIITAAHKNVLDRISSEMIA